MVCEHHLTLRRLATTQVHGRNPTAPLHNFLSPRPISHKLCQSYPNPVVEYYTNSANVRR